MIKTFRKKPVEVQAIQFTGKAEQLPDIVKFVGCSDKVTPSMHNSGKLGVPSKHTLIIKTLEGNMTAEVGDYIIKGVKGECYPCKPDIFELTYDEVN